jgi:hypothetical protein
MEERERPDLDQVRKTMKEENKEIEDATPDEDEDDQDEED